MLLIFIHASHIVNIASSTPTGIYNPLFTNPESLKLAKNLSYSTYIKSAGPQGSYAKFFVIRAPMDYSVDKKKSSKYHIAPFDFEWPKTASLLGALVKSHKVFMNSFMRGISFTTKSGYSTLTQSSTSVPVKVMSSPALPASSDSKSWSINKVSLLIFLSQFLFGTALLAFRCL